MVAVDSSGEMKWFSQVYPHDLLNYGLSIPPILASANIDGTQQDIVIGSGKTGRVYAFGRTTGAILWETIVGTHEKDQLATLPEGTTRVYPGGEGGVETPMAFADGTVYVSVIDMYADYTPSSSKDEDVFKATGELVAIQADTGKILWDNHLDTMNIGGATVVNDLVFTATISGKIYAFKRATGELVWMYQASPGINGWVAASGDTLVCMAGTDGKPALLALKLSSGPAQSNLTNAGSVQAAFFRDGSSYTVLNGPRPQVALQSVAEGLVAPTALGQSKDGRLFISEQTGTIRIVQNGSLLPTTCLNLSGKLPKLNPYYDERGLLGMALHPDFAGNGRIFVFYTTPLRATGPAGWDHTNRVSEFKVSSDDPNKFDPTSEKVILEYDVQYTGVNGGQLAFGHDGYLYISCGDGKSEGKTAAGVSPNPPLIGDGQNLTDFFGKILRIDINRPSTTDGTPYSIPPDNPFAGGTSTLERPEIFAYGFRDPSAMSFDTGDAHLLFVGNDGQDLFESVDIVVNGGDYGWPIREGTHGFNSDNQSLPLLSGPVIGPNHEPLIGPVIELGHDIGEAVIGGYIYRGKALPWFTGNYIFGDWSTEQPFPNGTLLVATPPNGWSPNTPGKASQLQPSNIAMWSIQGIVISSNTNGRLNTTVRGFGQDLDGELYLLTSDNAGPTGTTGKVFRIVSGQ